MDDYKIPFWFLVLFGLACGMLGYVLACVEFGPDENEPPVVEHVEILENE